MEAVGPAPRPRRGQPPRARRPAWPRVIRRLRVAVLVASTLVLGLNGVAWALYRDVTAGITTTNVISGSRRGGDQNILLVGVDTRTDAQGNPLPNDVLDALHGGPDTGVLNSDTIIVLHVPKRGSAAVAFSIPRDTYVDIPGYRRDKINAAYPAMQARTVERLVADGVRDRKAANAQAAEAGRSALIKTVESLTGLTIDHYAEINLLGFATLTTAIGGVEVCLAAPADDQLSGAHFPAGRQTLAGPQALAFVRQRHGLPEGDLSRIRRQQVFLAAVADRIRSAGMLTDPTALVSLVAAVQQSVVIDSGWDLLAFAQQASDIASGNLEFLTIPTTGRESNDRGDVVLVDRFAVRDFVDERIVAQQDAVRRETQEREAHAAGPAPAPFTVIPSRYVVDVRNGSSATGVAGTVATYLRGLGFIGGTVDNTEPASSSAVRFTGGDEQAADELAAHLGGIATERVDTGVSPGHLFVVLGADFDPAVVPPSPAPIPTGLAEAPITAASVPCVD